MRRLTIVGVVLIIAGMFVALRGVTYRSQRSDLKVGDFQASLEERRAIPSWIGWGVAAIGLALVAADIRPRRGA
jgi:hypothetical protein